VTILIPLRLPSCANLREHWTAKARRVKAQRTAVRVYIGGKPRPPLPVVVTLTRIAPRALDDDNLASAFKACRDEVATWLGFADNNPGIVWQYAQRKVGAKVYGIEIRVTDKKAAPV